MKVLLLLALVVATTAFDFPEEWIEWKNLYNKEYDNELLEIQRHIIWQANKKLIDEHNAHSDLFGYTLGLNEFADLSSSEFVATYTGRRQTPEDLNGRNSTEYIYNSPNTNRPSSIDWRLRGAVTPVQQQGGCGSCYTFASTGAVEGAHQIKTGRLIALSQQQILDCSSSYGNDGCVGGLSSDSFRYLAHFGSQSAASYPYEERVGHCRYNAHSVSARITGYRSVHSGSVPALLDAIAIQPISVAIYASNLQLQADGIMYCPATPELNHEVVAVGYGGAGAGAYYIMKNSWGTGWGDHGYFKLTRTAGRDCGATQDSTYPIAA